MSAPLNLHVGQFVDVALDVIKIDATEDFGSVKRERRNCLLGRETWLATNKSVDLIGSRYILLYHALNSKSICFLLNRK